MKHTLFVRWSAFTALLLTFAAASGGAQQATSGSVEGTVSSEGKPVAGASIHVARLDGTAPFDATSDAAGHFIIRGVPPGLYRLTSKRLGFREAQLGSFRIVSGQTASVHVALNASPTQLSTVEVRESATQIDSRSTELADNIRVADVQLVPMGRSATDLVALVPGTTKQFVWGGAGSAANNYQLDGIAMSHPGTGGDFVAPSIDWIESLEVKGLGAGAEYGDFQGGIINAITKTGTNKFQAGLRANYISPSLTATNILPNEEGAEQTMRREISGELRGPLIKDRLHYFLGGIVIDRNVAVPDLTTIDQNDLRAVQQQYKDSRGIAKLTLSPSARDRIDALASVTRGTTEHADITGLDDPSAATRVVAPTTVYEFGWLHTGDQSSLNARIAGFNASESHLGYSGDNVPGIQVYRLGRQPLFQNSTFNERLKPTSIGGNLTYKRESSFSGAANQFVMGADYRRGTFRDIKTRNGGLTWFPYPNDNGTINVANAPSWGDVASEWGGEVHLDSDVEDAAIFVQDYLTPIPNLTISEGARWGRWTGYLTPIAGATDGARFLAARAQAIDPRVGISWDVSGKNDFVVKAHFGRYHQGMNSVFFDRAEGADVYSNERFYLQGPDLTDPRQVFTPAQRDANIGTFTGFSPTYLESILNEAGKVENYRQPYVDQWLVSAEKKFGPRWKAEISYVNRVNRDIVGLVDRNRATNYSVLKNVSVKDRATGTTIYDEYGNPLVLPLVYVANNDLRNELIRRQSNRFPLPPVPGYSFADINTLTWNPDIALTTVPGAKRVYDQASLSIRTEQINWNGSLSFTASRLKGTVGGITGFGTTGTSFSAGSGVRPNEAINEEGRLPNVPAFDVKLWLGGNLIYGLRGGVFGTYTLGEYITPVFQFTPRFRLQFSDNTFAEDAMLHEVLGQTINLEERGARKYPGHMNLDVRLERVFGDTFAFTADIFNALGADAIIARNLTVNDGVTDDPTSVFGAPRRRVNPMALQVGMRLTY